MEYVLRTNALSKNYKHFKASKSDLEDVEWVFPNFDSIWLSWNMGFTMSALTLNVGEEKLN